MDNRENKDLNNSKSGEFDAKVSNNYDTNQNFNNYSNQQDFNNYSNQQNFNQGNYQQNNDFNDRLNQTYQQAYNNVNNFANQANQTNIRIGNYNFNLNEVIIFISALVILVGSFLPFISVKSIIFSRSISLIQSKGIIFIILAAVVCVLTFLKQPMIALLVGGLNLLYGLFFYFRLYSTLTYYYSLSFGAYVILIAIIGLFIGTLLNYIVSNRR